MIHQPHILAADHARFQRCTHLSHADINTSMQHSHNAPCMLSTVDAPALGYDPLYTFWTARAPHGTSHRHRSNVHKSTSQRHRINITQPPAQPSSLNKANQSISKINYQQSHSSTQTSISRATIMSASTNIQHSTGSYNQHHIQHYINEHNNIQRKIPRIKSSQATSTHATKTSTFKMGSDIAHQRH